MKKALVVILLILTIMAMLILPLLSCSPAGVAQTFELKYSNFFPATHQNSTLADSWSKEIEARTNGQVKITYYPGGTLTTSAKIYDGVVQGISDIGMSVLAYTPGRFPASEVVDLGLGYKTGTSATRVANDFYNKFKPKEFDDVHVLYFHAHGPGILHMAKNPVSKLEDLSGMKIRSTGIAAYVVKALGATDVAMGQGDAYDAMSKGVVDGSVSPMEVLKSWKQAEVAKYTTNCYSVGYTSMMFVVINKDVWDKFPSDVKKAFTDVSKEWIDKHAAAWDQIDKEGKEYALSLGNSIIELTPDESARWANAAKVVQADYVARYKDLPAQDYLDEVIKLRDKYNK